MATPIEAGLRNTRIHFIRESERGVTPTDPDWLRYADTVLNMTATPQATVFQRRGLGSPLIQGFHSGAENHEFSVQYYLQRFLVDTVANGGGGLDASGDALLRDQDNQLANSHSILARQNIFQGGALDGGRRIYTVVQGAKVDSPTLTGEPDSGAPLEVALNYQAEMIRSYVIEQPATGSTVDIVSTDAADTFDVTIESEGAAQSETLTLTGTTEVNGATSFDDIDAIWLDGDPQGDIVVSIDGTEISRIYGRNSYQGRVGDRGIPLLGAGSYEGEIGEEFAHFVGSTIERPTGTALDDNVMQVELTVANNIEVRTRTDTVRPAIFEGDVEATVTANVFGEKSTHEGFIQHLRVTENDLIWTLTKGELKLTGAYLSDPGSRVYTPGEAVIERGVTFTGKEVIATHADDL